MDEQDYYFCCPEHMMNRREAICLIGATAVAFTFFSGCRRPFKRPAGVYDLGEVKRLLYLKQHFNLKSILLFRDGKGWSALSTRCTVRGCQLTYQTETFLCSCCNSVYTHRGKVISGPAREPLPWLTIDYKNNHLYVNAGKLVDASYRFTTPEIEAEIEKVREMIKEQGVSPGVTIPDILLNKEDANGEDEYEIKLNYLGDEKKPDNERFKRRQRRKKRR